MDSETLRHFDGIFLALWIPPLCVFVAACVNATPVISVVFFLISFVWSVNEGYTNFNFHGYYTLRTNKTMEIKITQYECSLEGPLSLFFKVEKKFISSGLWRSRRRRRKGNQQTPSSYGHTAILIRMSLHLKIKNKKFIECEY